MARFSAGVARARRMRHNSPMGPSRPTDGETAFPHAPPPEVVRGLEALVDFYLGTGADAWIGDEAVDAFALTELSLAVRSAPAPSRGAHGDAGEGASPFQNEPLARPMERSAPKAPLTREPARAMPAPPAQAREGGEIPTIPGDEAIATAREAAATAGSLAELRDILSRFEGCNLRLTAKSLVFADGNPQADVMFVGEAPGREEDRSGVPFVGRSGQLLDLMLAAIGRDRSQAYITNVVPWRPPGNRTPSPQETEICKPFVMRQIELVRPKVLVFLGGASASALAGTQEGILRLRGRWLDVPLGPAAGGGTLRAMATLHPAYLLRNPIQKRYAWRDFLSIREALESA